MKCNCWNPEPHMPCDHDFDCVAYRTADLNLCGKCYGCGSAAFLLAWQPTRDDLVHDSEYIELEGVVDAWDNEKAFGFIKFNTGQRVFVHKNDTVGKIHLSPGSAVRGVIVSDTNGRARVERAAII